MVGGCSVFALYQSQCLLFADRNTGTTAETDVIFEYDRNSCGLFFEGCDIAGFDTGTAAVAELLIDFEDERSLGNSIMVASLNTYQQFTAAGTAITDKGGLLSDIVSDMGQVQRSCPLQNRQQLLGGLLRGEARRTRNLAPPSPREMQIPSIGGAPLAQS